MAYKITIGGQYSIHHGKPHMTEAETEAAAIDEACNRAPVGVPVSVEDDKGNCVIRFKREL